MAEEVLRLGATARPMHPLQPISILTAPLGTQIIILNTLSEIDHNQTCRSHLGRRIVQCSNKITIVGQVRIQWEVPQITSGQGDNQKIKWEALLGISDREVSLRIK